MIPSQRARAIVWNWVRRNRAALGIAVGVVAVLASILIVLGPLSWLIAGDAVRALHGKEQADALNTVRQTVLAAVAGTAVLLGLVFTARTYSLSRRGQVTERFRAAVGHLASDKLTERLGAVYGLEHVMAESPGDHNTVVGLLAAFIRENTKRDTRRSPGVGPPEQGMLEPIPVWGTEPPPDIRAAVDVLARRPERSEPRRVDLRSTTLVGLIVRSFDFDAPPRLSSVYFTGADLRRADLRGADLTHAILNGAELCLSWLHSARLDHAQLSRVDLRGALLGGATLVGADLCGADLRDTHDLTAEQLSGAVIDETSRLPSELANDPWVMTRLAECLAWRDQHASHEERVPPPTAPVRQPQ